VQRYQQYLDDSGMSDAEKQSFIEALWVIVIGFVDLGFGVHPLQEVCGQNPQGVDQQDARAEGSVECKQTRPSQTFNDTPGAD